MDTGFFIGGMLGRILGPVISDFIEYQTSWGHTIAQKKFEKERKSKQAEFDDKVRLAGMDHQHKIESLQIQFEQNRKRAEEQMLLSYSEWQQKIFWEKCFPLRNPFETPFGVKLEFQDSTERLKGCSLQTILLPNHKQIVPLRVIMALKETTHPHASTINGELSMFLAQYYSANNEHAVVSDIGAWKEDAPINDASINYLFRGQRGLPTLMRGNELTDVEKEQLMCLLQKTPPEIAGIVQRKTIDVITTIYSCATAMYADGFHLTQYGTLPILTYILPNMPGAKMLASQVQEYYLTLLNASILQGVISYESAIQIELDMHENFKRIGASPHELKNITKHIRGLVFDIKDKSLCDVNTINRIDSQIKLLLQ